VEIARGRIISDDESGATGPDFGEDPKDQFFQAEDVDAARGRPAVNDSKPVKPNFSRQRG
jgi:hypothetical protein